MNYALRTFRGLASMGDLCFRKLKLLSFGISFIFLFTFSSSLRAQTANALHFDGADDYVSISNPRDFDIGSTSDLIFTASIKTSSVADQYLFANVDLSGGIRGYQIGLTNGGKLTLDWESSAAGISIQGTSAINDGNCHDVRVEVDRSTFTAKLIVDGVEENSVTNTKYAADATPLNASRPVYLGSDRIGGMKWNGEIEDMIVSIGGTVQGAWTFNQGVAGGNNTGVTTLTDNSGQGNDGTLINFALTGTSSNWVTSTCNTALSNANALRFDGADDHVSVSNPRDFDIGSTSDLIFTASIKTYSAADQYLFANVDLSGAIRGYQIGLTNGGKLTLDWESSAAGISIQGTSAINDGNCHDVRVEVDRSTFTAKLIVDGVEENSVTNTKYAADATPLNASRPVYLGSDRIGGMKWNGEIEDMIVSIGGTVQGAWTFNQGVAGGNNTGVTTLTDNSGQGNDGTLINFALTGTSSNWVTSTCNTALSNANALRFDGADDKISVNNLTAFDIGTTSDLLLTATVKVNNGSTRDPLFSNMDDGFGSHGYQIWVDIAGKVELEWTSSALNSTVTGTTAINDGNCHEIKVEVIRSSGTVNIYVDNVLDVTTTNVGYGTSSDATPKNSATPVYIGGERTNQNQFLWNGEIEDLQVTIGGTLQGSWSFNQGVAGGNNSGITTLTDNSGQANNGTLQNFALNGTSSNWVTSTCNTANCAGDATNPTAVAQDVTIQLNASGQATLTAAQVDNGSSDNCDPNPTIAIDQTAFDCSHVGVTQPSNYALNFNGTDDYATVTIAGQGVINRMPVTVEAWVKPENRTDAANWVIDGVNTGWYPNNVISNDNPGKHGHGFGANIDATSGINVITIMREDGFHYVHNALTVDQWQHIAVVYETTGNSTANGTPGTVKTYVNGTLVDTETYNIGTFNGIASMYIGRHQDGTFYGTRNYFKGDVDEVRMWNKALTGAEIAANYQNTALATTTDLIGYYTFEDATGTTISDVNGSNDAVMTFTDANAAWVSPGAPVNVSSIGNNTVTLTVTDNSGNQHTATANITVEDNIAPTVNTQNIQVALVNGTATITPAQIDDNSMDNCAVDFLGLDKTTFTTADLGANTVTLTVKDKSGNTSTGTATVTVINSTFDVDFNTSAICADATEWLVPIDVGTIPADIGAFSLVLDHDETVMTFDAVHSTHANVDGTNNKLIANENNGKVYMTWSDNPAVTVSNATLLTLRFVPAGGATDFSAAAGTTVDFSFDQSVSTNNEFADGQANVLPATYNAQLAVAINGLPTPTLTSSDADNTVCAGEDVTFTAGGAGTGGTYNFSVDGTAQGASATNTLTLSNLQATTTVTVTVTDANGCSATHAGITTTVNPLPTPTLNVPNTTICSGDDVTYTAGGGTTYEFFLDGVSQGAGATATFTVSNVTVNPSVTVKVTDANGCSATHAGITLTINPLPTPTLTSSDADNTVCAGEDVTFTAGGAGTGGTYEFLVDGVSQGAASATNTLTLSNIQATTTVTVTVTDANGCSATHAGITTTVNPSPTPGLSSDKTNDAICIGETITFTGTGASGGTYEFFVNNASQGTASSTATFSSSSLANGDKVKVKVTNANGCVAESAEITVTVNELPTVTIAMDDTDAKVCTGSTVVYTATSTNANSVANEFIFKDQNGNILQAQSASNTYSHTANTDGLIVSVIGVNTTTTCQSAEVTASALTVKSCYDYSGVLAYYHPTSTNQTPLGNVLITLTHTTNGDVQTYTTDLNTGAFTFTNLFDNEDYDVTYTTGKTHGGINGTDALIIFLKSLNIINYPAPGTAVRDDASDPNGDDVVDVLDAVRVKLRFAYSINTFTAGDWAWGTTTTKVNGGNVTGQTWFSLAMGDVNYSYWNSVNTNESQSVILQNEGSMTVSDGQRVLIPVRLEQEDNLGAISLSMNIPSAAMTVHNVMLPDSTSFIYNQIGDELRMVWSDLNYLPLTKGDVMFYIDATINDVAQLAANPITLNSDSELADELATVLSPATISLPTISGVSTSITTVNGDEISIRNFPNPFATKMTIEYNIPMTADVNITIHNALGQPVDIINKSNQVAGTHRIVWQPANLANGMYFYTITVSDGNNMYRTTRPVILAK